MAQKVWWRVVLQSAILWVIGGPLLVATLCGTGTVLTGHAGGHVADAVPLPTQAIEQLMAMEMDSFQALYCLALGRRRPSASIRWRSPVCTRNASLRQLAAAPGPTEYVLLLTPGQHGHVDAARHAVTRHRPDGQAHVC
jgi:hypothetical protein